MLTGNVVSLFLGGIICAVVSFIFPEDYDFLSMRQIKVMDVAEDGDLGFAKVSHTLQLSLVLLIMYLICGRRRRLGIRKGESKLYIACRHYCYFDAMMTMIMDVPEDGDLGFAKVSHTLHSSGCCHYVAEN